MYSINEYERHYDEEEEEKEEMEEEEGEKEKMNEEEKDEAKEEEQSDENIGLRYNYDSRTKVTCLLHERTVCSGLICEMFSQHCVR